MSQNYKTSENVDYTARPTVPEVSEYMNEVVDQLDHLDYYFEDYYDSNELIELLQEDLPSSYDEDLKEAFIEDVVFVCDHFYDLIQEKQIRIQIEMIDTDKCRLFHVDYLKRRLLCTYHGLGTEWLDNSNVNRQWLGKGNNAKIIKNPALIRQTTPFDIIILKGDQFQRGFRGAVHRSPPVEHLRAKRVILKIDEL